MLSLINQKFCDWDPKAQAFNNFYRELLESKLYQKLAHEIQGHPAPAYNLLTSNQYKDLEEWNRGCEQEIFDLGCGLGVLAAMTQDQKVLGCDFSQVAVTHAKKLYPTQEFFLHHQNLGLPSAHKVAPFKVAIDALYINERIPNMTRALQKQLGRLLSGNTQSLYFIQNHYSPGDFDFRGFNLEVKDFTEDFYQLVAHWIKALQSPEVKEDAKIYPLLWSTIEREFSQHQRSLNERSPQRKRLLYTRT